MGKLITPEVRLSRYASKGSLVMNRHRKTLTLFSMLAGLSNCIEIHPIKPNELTNFNNPTTSRPCQQAPSIEQNIVGSWRAQSTYKSAGAARVGPISFDAKGTITDASALLENTIPAGAVKSKTYQFAKNSWGQTGQYIQIRWNAEEGYQMTPFVIVSNECNRIVLGFNGYPNEQ